MAGIGFELRRMIQEEGDLCSRARGYTTASLVSSGPWIVTIIGLFFVSAVAPLFVEQQSYEEFRAIVTYSFAFSLIVIGIVQMSFTRRVADLLYARRYGQLLPAFACAAWKVTVVQAGIGIAFAWFAGIPTTLAVPSILLYVVVSLTWLALVWLGTTKDYDDILRGYVYGTLLSFLAVVAVAAGLWGLPRTTSALVMAYGLGQGLTLFLLLRSVLRALDTGGFEDDSILKSVRTYPRLALVGLFYNAAIWIDQIVFWFTDGVGVAPYVRFHPLYDTCKFFAYATVIPALAVNLVRVETSFYDHYRSFYGSILSGLSLEAIEERKQLMIADLRAGTVRLLRVQGFVTLLALWFAPQIIEALGLGPAAVRVFRACSIGAFFHVLLLILLLVQLYFDLRRAALWTAGVFLASNAALAFWSVNAGLSTFGVGYTLSAFLSLAVGYALLARNLPRLEYLTFTQPAVELDPEPAVG